MPTHVMRTEATRRPWRWMLNCCDTRQGDSLPFTAESWVMSVSSQVRSGTVSAKDYTPPGAGGRRRGARRSGGSSASAPISSASPGAAAVARRPRGRRQLAHRQTHPERGRPMIPTGADSQPEGDCLLPDTFSRGCAARQIGGDLRVTPRRACDGKRPGTWHGNRRRPRCGPGSGSIDNLPAQRLRCVPAGARFSCGE